MAVTESVWPSMDLIRTPVIAWKTAIWPLLDPETTSPELETSTEIIGCGFCSWVAVRTQIPLRTCQILRFWSWLVVTRYSLSLSPLLLKKNFTP